MRRFRRPGRQYRPARRKADLRPEVQAWLDAVAGNTWSVFSEQEIESWLRRTIRACGMLSIKVNPRKGEAGTPDLLVVMPDHYRWWELKASGGRPSTAQLQAIAGLNRMPATVAEIIGPADIPRCAELLVRTGSPPTTGWRGSAICRRC